MQMSAMLKRRVGILVYMAIAVLFFTDPYKTLHICYKFIGLALNELFKRSVSTFGFDLGFTTLNVHKIWPCLLRGEHTLYIRAKMT